MSGEDLGGLTKAALSDGNTMWAIYANLNVLIVN